ncbi:MAG: hypothetical protein ABI557_16540, partial [Aureliella sp.]
MRFQINCQQLTSLLLASCAISASFQSMSSAQGADGGASGHTEASQQPGLIEFVTAPNLGVVTTASGSEIAGVGSSRTRLLTAAVLITQPPKDLPEVPAPTVLGPGELTEQRTSPSDIEIGRAGDNAVEENELKTDSFLKFDNNYNDAINNGSGIRGTGQADDGIKNEN